MRLESVDAWVDPATQGARLIARASLPLVLVGTSVGGVKVYAGRDEREGSAARFVQFIVVGPASQTRSRSDTLMAMRQDGNSGAQASGCGRVRMPLVVDAKYGDSAIVSVTVELPSHDPGAVHAKIAADTKADAREAAEAAATASTSAALKGKRRFKGKGAPPPPPPSPPLTPAEHEVRTREVQIHLSVSQTARGLEPQACYGNERGVGRSGLASFITLPSPVVQYTAPLETARARGTSCPSARTSGEAQPVFAQRTTLAVRF